MLILVSRLIYMFAVARMALKDSRPEERSEIIRALAEMLFHRRHPL